MSSAPKEVKEKIFPPGHPASGKNADGTARVAKTAVPGKKG